MNRLTILSRLLITAVVLGALTQIASLTYHLSAESTDAGTIRPIDLTAPERHNDAARFALIHAIAEQYGIAVADRTAHWHWLKSAASKSVSTRSPIGCQT